jgi:hypothetical protein
VWGRLLTRAQDAVPMLLSFPKTDLVGRSPWTAADAPVGSPGLNEVDFLTGERVQGDPRRPGGLPHSTPEYVVFGTLNDTKKRDARMRSACLGSLPHAQTDPLPKSSIYAKFKEHASMDDSQSSRASESALEPVSRVVELLDV